MNDELTESTCGELLGKIRKILGGRGFAAEKITLELTEPHDWSVTLLVPSSVGKESIVMDAVQLTLAECSINEECLAYLGKTNGNYVWYFTHPDIPPSVKSRLDAEVLEDELAERDERIAWYAANGVSMVPIPNHQKAKGDSVYLTIDKTYFDAIESGDKTTEFRILNQYYADKLLGKDEPLKFVKLQDGYGGKGRKKPRQMKFEISGIVLADDYGIEFPAYSNGNPTTDKDLPEHFLPTMYGIKLGKRVDLDF